MNLLQFQSPVIAHRGGAAYAPENTMAALTKAVQLGLRWVEFDVMLASCGTPIVFHDETLDRTTNGRGPVGDYSYTYLQTLDAGTWFNYRFAGERIPTLAQVIEFLKSAKMSMNVEIKPLPGQDKITAMRALDILKPFYPHLTPSLLFSSFSIEALRTLRQEAPTSNLGLLMHQWLPDWQTICDDLQCVSVHLNDAVITAERAKEIKNSGRLLLCYTINEPKRAKELFSWGVDAVFSDAPNMIEY